MIRDIESICDQSFDLLVIGAGIQGAAIASKASQSGLRVVLLECDDFCGASSSNSLKILHGGLRYLQTLDFRRMRHSIRSRRELMQLAPHLVQPLACAIPAYGHGLKGREVMRMAMLANDMISLDRNTGLAEDKRLPAGHCISKAQCLEFIPGIESRGLHGASVWYDALAINTERLALEYILAAQDSGAQCRNYVAVETLSRVAEGGIKVRATDRLAGQSIQLQAGYVINCAGASYEDLIPGSTPPPRPERWARGLNIVVRKKMFTQGAVALEKNMDAQKRMLFMVPWRDNYTMIGTHYLETDRHNTLFPVDAEAIMAMVDEVNIIYPAAELSFDDVSFYHAGFLPMQANSPIDSEAQPLLSKESKLIDHGREQGFDNFFSIKGIKYTTAPQVAERVLKMIGVEVASPPADAQARTVRELSKDVTIHTHLLQRYAQGASRLGPYVDEDSSWVDSDRSLLRAEVRYFMQDEMACHLTDVVFRRSELGTAQCPPMATLETIADQMSDYFNWNATRRAREIDQVLQRYAPLKLFHR